MKRDVIQRVTNVVEFSIYSKLALDKKDLAQKLGYNASSFSQIINARVPISDKFLEKLLDFVPNLNEKWLLFGEGEMLTTEPNAVPIQPMEVNIDTGEAQYKEPEPIPATAEVIPILPTEIARRTNTNIREFIEQRGDELEHIDPRQLLHSPDLAERVMGASMLPTFAPGDVVFVKFLPDINHIIDGKTYYLDLRSLPTMVRKVKIEGEQLRLIAKNPNYADIVIDRQELQNVGIIVGMFRNSFADGYDEVEAVRRKKDNQIDKLIDQNAKALESIGNLVEVIRNER